MADPSDLFGNPTGPRQLSLFGDGEKQMSTPVQSYAPDPDVVRKRLQLVLLKARKADTMPWPERELRMWQTVFPQMTNWLPDEEATQLRFDFIQQIERLRAA